MGCGGGWGVEPGFSIHLSRKAAINCVYTEVDNNHSSFVRLIQLLEAV